MGELQLKADHFKSVKSIIRIDAWDTEGCAVQANKEAFVTIASISHPETCIPIPNVFTSDGDGINDVFLGGDEFAYHGFVWKYSTHGEIGCTMASADGMGLIKAGQFLRTTIITSCS